MANLRCFYCNRKSSLKFTGQKQWACKLCLATNFLDENGEITDPPVATFKTVPVDRKHLVQRPDSPPSRPSSPGSDSAFCSTCIQNQNLYIKSLAQYDFDTNTERPGYVKDEQKYFAYKKALERRYPQVCEDCQPKALGMMRDANKVAKNDYLRRLMDKSRGTKARIGETTLYGSVVFFGKFLWYFGLITQLLWHIMALASGVQHNLYSISDVSDPSDSPFSLMISTTLSTVSEYLISLPALKSWAYRGLICGLVSIWWNPKFRDFERGVPKHITGFGEWYKQAAILLAVRSFIFYVTGTSALADPYASVTLTCHGFAVIFVTYLATAVNYTLKVDVSPLWETTPEKFNIVGPKAPKPLYNPSMKELLDDISRATGRPRISPPGNNTGFGYSRKRSISPVEMALEREKAALTRYAECEAMDWHPTPPVQPLSQHRAFAPDQPAQRRTQLFGQAPVAADLSAFWYKVPPAPITPAHRLRNPPNQPRIQAASAESKDKFLIPMGKKIPTLPPKKEKSPEYYLAQQRFFPIAERGIDESDLAGMMTGFSLGEDPIPPKTGFEYWQVVKFATVCGALGLALAMYKGASLASFSSA